MVDVAVAAQEFPVADDAGVFAEGAGETIYAPVLGGLCARIELVQQADGWRFGYFADLPEEHFRNVPVTRDQEPVSTRVEAVVGACEALIYRLSSEKERVRASKRHREAAGAMQDWALEVARTERELAPDEREEVAVLEMGAVQFGLRMVAVDELYESPWNPRQAYPEEAMQALTESMRKGGFWPYKPLRARPIGETTEVWRPVGVSGGYELGAGHRRLRAAKAAGIAAVPCVIEPMTDEELLEVLNFDNVEGDPVHPLYVQAGWRKLLERPGTKVEDIAARLGWSARKVYNWLKCEDLIPEAKEVFLAGGFTTDHAWRIAARPAEVQKQALKFLKANPYDGRVPSTRDLDRWLHQSQTMDLEDAPFDREDATLLSGAGTCVACPKRSGNDPGFVAPVGVEENLADLCCDPKCYRMKVDNHLARIVMDVQAKEPAPVLKVSTSWGTSKKKDVVARADWEVAEDGVGQPAVVVEGPETGKVLRVRLKSAAQADSVAGAAGGAGPSPADVVEEAARKRVIVDREMSWRRALLSAVKSKIGGLSRADIEALLVKHFGGFDVEGETICELHGIETDAQGAGAALARSLPKMKEQELFAVVVEAAVIEELQDWQSEETPEGLLALAKRYKVDAAKIRRELEGGAKKPATKKASAPAKKAAKKAAKKKAAPAKKSAKKGGKK